VPATSTFGLRYPTLANAANVPLDVQNLATDTDGALVGINNRLTTVESLPANLAAKYSRNVAQAISNVLPGTKVAYTTVDYNQGSVVAESSGVLTLNKTGLWALAANHNMATGTSIVYAWIGHGTNTAITDRYVQHIQSSSADLLGNALYVERRFTAGSTVAFWIWSNANRNTAVDVSPWLSARYLGA
jgi:hypothetical protein